MAGIALFAASCSEVNENTTGQPVVSQSGQVIGYTNTGQPIISQTITSQATTISGQQVAQQGTQQVVHQQPVLSPQAQQLNAMVNDAGFMSSIKGADRYSVARFYRQRNFEPAWQDQGSWNLDGVAVHRKLIAAEDEGLNPSHYLDPAQLAGQLANGLDTRSMLMQDIQMTAGVLAFAKDARFGRYNKSGGSYPVEEMAAMLNRGYIEGYIANMGPDTPAYQGLRTALKTRGETLSREQKGKIAVNMERLRWNENRSQGTSSHFIRVNIAAAELTAYQNGSKAFDMPVVVGRSTRPTPLLNDRIVNLKYSPDWGVPKTVIEKDYLPRLQKNPNYLKERGFQAFSGGKEVDFASINFKDPNEYRRYSYRKAPGGQNPLGGVRFSLTNSMDIYLHDAPGSSQFKAKKRSRSSGCVRVADAAKLAKWVHSAQGQELSLSKIKSDMRLSAPKYVRLSNPVDVHLTYLTAWVDDLGELKFASDVYGLDKKLANQMDLTI